MPKFKIQTHAHTPTCVQTRNGPVRGGAEESKAQTKEAGLPTAKKKKQGNFIVVFSTSWVNARTYMHAQTQRRRIDREDRETFSTTRALVTDKTSTQIWWLVFPPIHLFEHLNYCRIRTILAYESVGLRLRAFTFILRGGGGMCLILMN